MSENARNLVIELIKKCEDTFEIVEHKRNTPLAYDATPFFFPTSVKKNDALIVFSRQKVLRVAAELRANGIEPSVIYGALPYSVRKNEIHRFMSGETSVIVSTDAIGMGMNLPVKRIVFLESTKFDGTENRLLLGPEIKQIAGRAGRQGMFNVGHFTALSEKEYIQDCFYEAYKPLKRARIQLPEKLLDLDIPLSTIIKQWMTVTSDEIYEKEDMEIISEKCAFLESLLKRGYEMDKRMMWRFITIPFDEKNYRLKELWEMLVVHVLEKGDIAESVDSQLSGYDSLEALEADYKILDLYFSFARTIHYNKNNFRQTIMERKDEIAVKIMRELEKKQYNQKKCRKCGCKLSWDYEYGLCEDCYIHLYRPQSSEIFF